MYEPTEGCILFDGIDIKEFALVEWQTKISFVFQSFIHYEATAGANIAYGDWKYLYNKPEQVKHIARLAKVDELISSMPQRYDTLLGRIFGQYTPSVGQWQKLAIARAFARQDSMLLILDEPTASLDTQAEYELFRNFTDLTVGKTTLLISHRFSTVSIADKILVFSEGRLVENGSHEELLTPDGHYATFYRLWHSNIKKA